MFFYLILIFEELYNKKTANRYLLYKNFCCKLTSYCRLYFQIINNDLFLIVNAAIKKQKAIKLSKLKY